MLAARHITITAMVTVKAAIKGKPSIASDGTFISRKAVIQAITTPKMLQVSRALEGRFIRTEREIRRPRNRCRPDEKISAERAYRKECRGARQDADTEGKCCGLVNSEIL